MIAALIALVAAGWTLATARATGTERLTYPVVLAAMPFIYVAFAGWGDPDALVPELIATIPFVAVGGLCLATGFSGSALILAAGWLGHGFYDLYHDAFVVNAGVPSWYALLCGVYDLVVAGYIVWLSGRLPRRAWGTMPPAATAGCPSGV